ncbi:hypothetical protein [Niveibacterium terrae]|uniref:hypothetical protein n=1 Tax=Niveibacterium terrae TaxID=3373598 RepID=UPI003A8DBC7E
MRIYAQNRFVSVLAILLGAVTAPLLFKAAGLPGGWIFEGPAQFILTIAATAGLMIAFGRVGDRLASRLSVFRKSSRG